MPQTLDENLPLAKWVKCQRHQYKLKQRGEHSTLTDAQIDHLKKGGFIWDSHVLVWEERFQEPLEYKIPHGNCNAPGDYPKNHQLAMWVKRQQRQYKLFWEGDSSTTMTIQRIGRLVAVGFLWECHASTSSDEWDSSDKNAHDVASSDNVISLSFPLSPAD